MQVDTEVPECTFEEFSKQGRTYFMFTSKRDGKTYTFMPEYNTSSRECECLPNNTFICEKVTYKNDDKRALINIHMQNSALDVAFMLSLQEIQDKRKSLSKLFSCIPNLPGPDTHFLENADGSTCTCSK